MTEVYNDQGNTISSLDAQLTALNEEFLSILQSPPDPADPAIIKVANLLTHAQNLVGERNDLEAAQKTADSYAAKISKNYAGMKQRDQLREIRERAAAILADVDGRIHSLPASPDAITLRRAATKQGVPDDVLQRIEMESRDRAYVE